MSVKLIVALFLTLVLFVMIGLNIGQTNHHPIQNDKYVYYIAREKKVVVCNQAVRTTCGLDLFDCANGVDYICATNIGAIDKRKLLQ